MASPWFLLCTVICVEKPHRSTKVNAKLSEDVDLKLFKEKKKSVFSSSSIASLSAQVCFGHSAGLERMLEISQVCYF